MKVVLNLALISACLLLANCAGPSFEKEWKTAIASYEEAGNEEPIVGPWKGSWLTPSNGHEGDLRCIISPSDAPHVYNFRYHATWAGIFSGAYRAQFEVEPVDEGYYVEGAKDLGIFGEFTHEGLISNETFHSTFEATGHQGDFRLRRP